MANMIEQIHKQVATKPHRMKKQLKDPEYMREIGRAIKKLLPNTHHFLLLAFPARDKSQHRYYLSNGDKRAAIATAEEWLSKLDTDGDDEILPKKP